MLLTCIHAEFMKLKRSFVWPAFLIVPVIPAILGTGNYRNNLGVLSETWYALWTQHTLFYGGVFFAPLIAVYCAYLWRVENFGHNRNALMAAPVPLSALFLGKFFVTALMTFFTQTWVVVLFAACGKYVGLPGLPPLQIVCWALRGGLGGLACAAALLLLSMCIRSFALPVGLSLVLSLIGLLLTNKGWGLYYPFSLIAFGMNANDYSDLLSGQLASFLISCGAWTALFFVVAVWLLRTRDVRA